MRPRPLVVLLGIGLGIAGFAVLAQRSADFDPEDAALGANTVSRTASFEGVPVTARAPGRAELRESIERLRAEGHGVALWLGASQLHGINEFRNGDELAVWHANESARARGSSLRYVQISLPNANSNELLGAYLWLRAAGQLPDWLIVAVTYDDLREPGVRAAVLNVLPPLDESLVLRAGEGIHNLEAALGDRDRHAPIQRTVTSGTPQERLEQWLSAWLERGWAPYASRMKVQALATLKLRRLLASTLGAIGERRAPPVPRDIQHWNEAALDTLVRLAREDGARVLLYQPPHPQYTGSFYHDRRAYDAFYASLRERYRGDGAAVVDLETLVPVEYWGLTNEGRPDVFHFSAEGHRRLGEAVDAAVAERSTLAVQ